ncbi:peptidase M50 [Halomonas huangheensis]|nr:peptidase M50 [Halomonas huangheensis]
MSQSDASQHSEADPRTQQPVPPLRDDLHLVEVAHERDGEPAWCIEDPVTNRFFRIGWLEFEILRRWGQSPERICHQIQAQTALEPDVDQILSMVEFLDTHHLLRPDIATVDRFAAQANERSPWLKASWWLHNYLFFRLPLVRPQHALRGMARALPWLFTRACVVSVLLLGLLGILLVVQRWDRFTHAVVEAFSLSGLVSFACALVVAKSLHELGHALVATRLGVKVAHMGVAFIVLWPMLYTDTGESWKLKGSRQRLAISSAGILTELALAGLATLGWVMTQPGALNSALLYLATTSWVLSLALNSSPFMRFDGYFILTDVLDFPNLHERAGGQARCWLRRNLLGLDESWPEPFSRSHRRALVLFAFATWLYRLVLFLGIAVAVYALFFKALGIILFVVEILWFIVRPVTQELSHWWSQRQAVPGRFRLAWLLVAMGLAALLFIPWQTSVGGPGVIHSARAITYYAPMPAKLERRHDDGKVDKGAALVSLVEPDIGLDLAAQQVELDNIDAQLTGLLANPKGEAQLSAAQARRLLSLSNIEAHQREITRLHLSAPFAGSWQRINEQLLPGQWLSPREPLGVLIDPEHWVVEGYIDQQDVHRLEVGSPVRFFIEGQTTPLQGELVRIAPSRTRILNQAMLAERHGGVLKTQQDSGGNGEPLQLEQPLFAVQARIDSPWPETREARGRLHVDAERQSLAARLGTWIAAVAVRESGF